MAIRLEANLSDIEGDMLLLAHADVNDSRPEMLLLDRAGSARADAMTLNRSTGVAGSGCYAAIRCPGWRGIECSRWPRWA